MPLTKETKLKKIKAKHNDPYIIKLVINDGIWPGVLPS